MPASPAAAWEGASPPVIGVAIAADPTDPQSWSGISRGVLGGLEALGVRTVPLRATPPGSRHALRVLARSYATAAMNPIWAAANSAAVRWAMTRNGAIDGVVQLGSQFRVPSGTPMVTLEDITVRMAVRMPNPSFTHFSERGLRRWVNRQEAIYRQAVACCAASSWAARSIVSEYGIDPAKVHVVGLGSDARPDLVERSWDRPRFLFVGREWWRKDGPLVLRAFARLREELPEARLDVVGGHPPLEAEGVTGHGMLRLRVEAERRRVLELFSRATCFVMPSTWEAFGIVYVEAGAAGIPSIGTTVGGAADAIGDGGRLVPPGNEDALLAAMRELADPPVARALGDAARQHAARLTWEAVAGRLLRAMALPGLDPAALPDYLPRRTFCP